MTQFLKSVTKEAATWSSIGLACSLSSRELLQPFGMAVFANALLTGANTFAKATDTSFMKRMPPLQIGHFGLTGYLLWTSFFTEALAAYSVLSYAFKVGMLMQFHQVTWATAQLFMPSPAADEAPGSGRKPAAPEKAPNERSGLSTTDLFEFNGGHGSIRLRAKDD